MQMRRKLSYDDCDDNKKLNKINTVWRLRDEEEEREGKSRRKGEREMEGEGKGRIHDLK